MELISSCTFIEELPFEGLLRSIVSRNVLRSVIDLRGSHRLENRVRGIRFSVVGSYQRILRARRRDRWTQLADLGTIFVTRDSSFRHEFLSGGDITNRERVG